MARYAVEHIWEGRREYFLIRDHQSWQMVLLPSKYLTHLTRANRSPNTAIVIGNEEDLSDGQ